MEQRGQFTFYSSYWDAVEQLSAKKREVVLSAVIVYALKGIMPQGLGKVENSLFLLIKPTLDASRKKAAAGKQGGSKRQANGKQMGSEGEKEAEKEGEVEAEKEVEKEIETEDEGQAFAAFWAAYPVKIDKKKALSVWIRKKPEPEAVMKGLAKWKDSRQWEEQSGRFIPRAAKWLEQEHYLSAPENCRVIYGCSGQMGEAELEAIARVLREE